MNFEEWVAQFEWNDAIISYMLLRLTQNELFLIPNRLMSHVSLKISLFSSCEKNRAVDRFLGSRYLQCVFLNLTQKKVDT